LFLRGSRSNRDEFFDASLPGRMEQLHSHHQVIVEELRRMVAVCADAADNARGVNDEVRACIAV
jgi:hypothetical protein